MKRAKESLKGKARWPAATALVLTALLALGGCGGGGGGNEGTSGPSTTSAANQSSPATPPQQNKPRKHADQESRSHRNAPKSGGPNPPSGGAAEFETPGGDNSIPRYGNEAENSELAEAAEVLHDYLDARIAGDWSGVCAALSRSVQASLVRLANTSAAPANAKTKSCAKIVGALFSAIPPAAAREAAIAEVAALRVKGERGFLLFHGAHDVAYVVRMQREKGRWKLAAPAPSILP
jgi:hypothetical protein